MSDQHLIDSNAVHEYCFQRFWVLEWLHERVQHFGSTTFGEKELYFAEMEEERYNQSTTVSVEMKTKKDPPQQGRSSETLDFITFRSTVPAGP